jgi:sec-independent protein translocase protein TatC
MALVPFPGRQSGAAQLPPREPEEREDSLGGKMLFLEHLDELRKRIIRSIVAIAVGIAATFAFIEPIFNFILAPTRAALPPDVRLIYTRPGEAFSLWITVALISGVVVSAPYIMYQVWKFIAPGLYSNEKRLAIPFVLLTTVGGFLGAAFNHYIGFPFMMRFFASFNTPDLAFMPKLDEVFGLYTKMLIGLSVIFQMPALVYFLARLKLVTARFLWRQAKYAVFAAFIIAAVLTPTSDPMSQTLFAAPIIALYFVSIVVAWIANPSSRERPEA